MIHFGVVVAGAAQPRASRALRQHLPDLFPQHGFVFFEAEELPLEPRRLAGIVFRVIGSAVDQDPKRHREVRDRVPDETYCTIQEAIDHIVARAEATLH
jgi:hypothetical protein